MVDPAWQRDAPMLVHCYAGISRSTATAFIAATYPIWLVSLIGAGIGALAGGGSLWLMGFLWEKLRGVEAMGLGDVKMMAMVGAFLGLRATLLFDLLTDDAATECEHAGVAGGAEIGQFTCQFGEAVERLRRFPGRQAGDHHRRRRQCRLQGRRL